MCAFFMRGPDWCDKHAPRCRPVGGTKALTHDTCLDFAAATDICSSMGRLARPMLLLLNTQHTYTQECRQAHLFEPRQRGSWKQHGVWSSVHAILHPTEALFLEQR
ncbi:unnamed protein product [Ectocarpus sp. 8 AP-2014]